MILHENGKYNYHIVPKSLPGIFFFNKCPTYFVLKLAIYTMTALTGYNELHIESLMQC